MALTLHHLTEMIETQFLSLMYIKWSSSITIFNCINAPSLLNVPKAVLDKDALNPTKM